MMFLLEDGNIPFSIALALMLMIAVVEGALTILGVGISQALDSVLPDFELEADLPDNPTGGLSKLLGWIRFGQLPALIILVVFLTAFGLSGLAVQHTASSLLGQLLPSWIAVIPALMISLPSLRFVGGLFSKIMVKDETEAISRDSFIGNVATITIGEACKGSAAEARFSDQYGTNHYIMVEPDTDDSFKQGDEVLIVKEVGSYFKVIKPTSNLQ